MMYKYMNLEGLDVHELTLATLLSEETSLSRPITDPLTVN